MEKNKMKEIKLNIGGGDKEMEGFTILDGKFGNDITKLDYPDNSVDEIYSSHTLEYFDRDEAFEVLNEWYRVLKVGGKIYLSVPDFRIMAELYLRDSQPLHKFVGPLFGKMTMGDKVIYHKTVYDYSSLGELLRIIGFRRIDLYNSEDYLGSYDDCSKARIGDYEISLNICAEKNEYEGKK